jgi:hypothetical protein
MNETYPANACNALQSTSCDRSDSIKVRFKHGLGDCVHFAMNIVLAGEQGHRVVVECDENKALLFRAASAQTTLEQTDFPNVPWHDPYWSRPPENAAHVWEYNKSAVNLATAPMPALEGTRKEQWERFCAIQLSFADIISNPVREDMRLRLEGLPKPFILVHSIGNTAQHVKQISEYTTLHLYDRLLDETSGTLLLLDWDNRVPRLSNWRVRHLEDDWHKFNLQEFLTLLSMSDLLIGVDSGPLHTAGCFGVPTVGVWPVAEHIPSKYLVPRANQISVVPSHCDGTNILVRDIYNIYESSNSAISGDDIAEAALSMLRPTRYLPNTSQGADAMLQQWVLNWERGAGSPLTTRVDRDRGFDLVLREIMRRFPTPTIVETGCIRAPEDWRGAGFSTYLLARIAQHLNGRLFSVDNSEINCAFARSATAGISSVAIFCADSIAFLETFPRPIDVLLLDSWDTNIPGFAEHSLREARAALRCLGRDAILIFDDTVYSSAKWHGKGELAVPWLLDSGWYVFHSGIQTVLMRRADGNQPMSALSSQLAQNQLQRATNGSILQ